MVLLFFAVSHVPHEGILRPIHPVASLAGEPWSGRRWRRKRQVVVEVVELEGEHQHHEHQAATE